MQGGTKKGMILPFIRLAITFRDIHYYVPMPEVSHTATETFTSCVMPAASPKLPKLCWVGGACLLNALHDHTVCHILILFSFCILSCKAGGGFWISFC